MDDEAQLKLQASLDGELSEKEARQVAELLARDPEAAALMAELRQTREALAGFEAEIKVPESREFYWSKIQREIARQQEAPAPESGPPLWLSRVRRYLMPATAVAFLALVCVLALNQPSSASASTETSLADAGAVTYHDYASGTTVVWLSYPADDETAGRGGMDKLK